MLNAFKQPFLFKPTALIIVMIFTIMSNLRLFLHLQIFLTQAQDSYIVADS